MTNLITSISTATSGTVALADTQQDIVLFHDAASLAATLTITMPATPINGQRVCLSSTLGVTALTLTATVGAITNLITALVVGTPIAYMYNLTQNKWFKVS
jgi:hypothetical protein